MTAGKRNLIGFESTALEISQQSGVSCYTAHLLHALARQGGDWQLTLLSSRPPVCPIPANVRIQAGRQLPNRTLWMQFVLPRIVRRLRPDACHFTNSIAPLSLSCPYAVSVYDMSLFLFPRLQPRKSLWLVRSILPAVTRKAAAVITVSESSKRDICRVLGVVPGRVHVIHGAAGDLFRVIEPPAELERVKSRYGLDTPFILSVSTLEPRKNLERLVAAFAQLRRQGRRERLVLAGRIGWHCRPLLRQMAAGDLKDAIQHIGYVPAADLPAIYNLARVVAFPSLYEGFGLPIVEAMKCGVPVLTADRSATAEVGEGAALLVDPLSVEAIADGLRRLLDSASLRADLREKGLARAARFSWDDAAGKTLSVYRSIINGEESADGR